MPSLILQTATRYLLPLLLLFSIFLLLRGHNEPGGGFVGGLVAASAFATYALAFNVQEARATVIFSPRKLIANGLLLVLISGFIGMPGFEGQRPFLTGVWIPEEILSIPVLGKIGTPLIFDIGVYLVVVGITLVIIFAMRDDEEE